MRKSKGIFAGILIGIITLGAVGSLSAITKGFRDWSFDDISFPHITITDPSDTPSDTSFEDPSDTSSDEEEELFYSITFSPSTTNTQLLDADGIKAIGSSDAQLMTYISTEKLYREAPDSIKFGTSSARGVLSFELPERERILSVVIEARSYVGDNTTIKVNDVEQALTSSKEEYEFDYSALETATVNITSKNNTSNRFYVSAITIIHSGEEIAEPAQPVYHRVEAERYEIVLPRQEGSFQQRYEIVTQLNGLVNEPLSELFNIIYSFDDSVGIIDFSGEETAIVLCLLNANSDSQTEDLLILPGEYGRYTISQIQAADEPVAFTLEPIYEYVLVE